MRLLLALLLVLVRVPFGLAQDRPGTLDSSFGTNGIVSDFIANTYPMAANDCVLQPDGKILTAGCIVTRRLPNGVPDLSFAGTGHLDLYKLFGDISIGGKALLRPDGKIVVVGSFRQFQNSRACALQLLPDGKVDSSFGVDGCCWLRFASISDAKLMNDGSILASATTSDIVVEKVTVAGKPDSAFGVDGLATVSNSRFGRNNSYVDTTADGRIVVVFNSVRNGNYYAAIVRFVHNGRADSGFGVNGVIYPFLAEHCAGAVVQRDGKILASFRGQNSYSLYRFLEDGRADSSYGQNGMYEMPPGTDLFKLLGNGQVICAGSDGGFVVAKLKADGAGVDSSFGTQGITHTAFMPDSYDHVFAVAIQEDGNILCAGKSRNDLMYDGLALARYHDVPPVPTNTVAVKAEPALTLYPNPAGPELHLSGIPSVLYNASYQILTSAGQMLQRGALPQQSVYSIHVASLPAGLYYLRLLYTAITFLKQ